MGLVFNDLVGGAVPLKLPAIVKIEVFVPFGGESCADEEIGSLFDELFVDVAVELIP